MNTPKQDVAVFIDFENIYVSVREKFDATPNFEAIMERCEDYGRIVVARAYADWYRYPRITSALFANNIEPMYVPTYYYDKDEGRTGRPIKNSVDMHMCIDAMRTLYTRTNISTYIFITGDRDFIALVNCVRQEGKNVIIIGIGGAASSHLAQSADEFLFYEQIVDIRPMSQTGRRADTSPRQLERVERPERYDRERSNGRDERKRERAPERSNERPERGAERPAVQPERLSEKPASLPEKPLDKPLDKPADKPAEPSAERPAPIVAIPVAASDTAIYDKLVEALHLARKRGYVSSFGSLKVLMKEIQPNFKETRYRDPQGKPFTKFTDFVREAERLGKIQIFTNGTVNEVFLPDEDPYKLSQFAEDLPSVEAERELEQELAQAADEATDEPQEQPSATAANERHSRRRRRRGGLQSRTSTDAEPQADAPTGDEETSALDETFSFGEREWSLFDKVMREYADAVPFADIFNALRELRNTEELDLTNNALKELIKQAINAGKVQRTNRGAKAHYRVIPGKVHEDATPALPDLIDDEPAQLRGPADELELPDLIDDEPLTLSAPTPPQKVEADPSTLNPLAALGSEPLLSLPVEAEPAQIAQPSAPATDAVEIAPPASAEQPKRTTRRRKTASDEPAAAEAAPPASAEQPKRTTRRRKTASDEPAAAEAAPPAAEPPTEPKRTTRRRRAPAVQNDTSADVDVPSLTAQDAALNPANPTADDQA